MLRVLGAGFWDLSLGISVRDKGLEQRFFLVRDRLVFGQANSVSKSLRHLSYDLLQVYNARTTLATIIPVNLISVPTSDKLDLQVNCRGAPGKILHQSSGKRARSRANRFEDPKP